MNNKKKKFYVIWKGRETGIFSSWEECKKHVQEFDKAQYKSFSKLVHAKEAYKMNYYDFVGKPIEQDQISLSADELLFIGRPIVPSISVDAAWNVGNGDVEYRGVDTETKRVIFHSPVFKQGTINIGEFLAILHGLYHLKTIGSDMPLYSDSRTAISWIRNKKAKTELEKTDKNKNIFHWLERAELWLAKNTYTTKVLKWETKAWGENPADFGRK